MIVFISILLAVSLIFLFVYYDRYSTPPSSDPQGLQRRDVVRVVVVRGDQVLLMPDPSVSQRWIHPLCGVVPTAQSIITTVDQLTSRYTQHQPVGEHASDHGEAPESQKRGAKFLLRYNVDPVYPDDVLQVVHLFILDVTNDTMESPLPSSRFVSCAEIDAFAAKGQVNQLFMEEYAYLKNTVLLCNNLLSQKK